MSTDRAVTRALRSWLHEDAHEDADRVLSAVLEELETTPQRRPPWLAWRFPIVSNTIRIAVAAGAVALALFIGYRFVSGPSVGGPTPSASATALPSATPTASPTPVATPSAFPPSGALSVGRHSMTLAGHRLSMEFPTAGWTSNGEWGVERGSPTASDSAAFIFWPDSPPDNVFSNPCSETLMSPPPGRTAVELAAAVARVPGLKVVSKPSTVSVGGYPAQHVVLTVPNDIGCAPNQFYLWEDLDTPGNARYATEVGETFYVWIVQVNSSVVWIDAETFATSSASMSQEVQQIIDSIRFE